MQIPTLARVPDVIDSANYRGTLPSESFRAVENSVDSDRQAKSDPEPRRTPCPKYKRVESEGLRKNQQHECTKRIRCLGGDSN